MPADAAITLASLMLEAAVGYPRALLSTIGHPVTWMGRVLEAFELRWNDPWMKPLGRRILGLLTVVIVAGSAAALGQGITLWASGFDYGIVIIVLCATTGLAQRSLYQHVYDVLVCLQRNDLATARTMVGRIVGRDTDHLTTDEVAGAAIESLGESFNDGVVTPTFWLLIGGLPGLLAYKAINTADSLIGHMEERWRAFGWAAARLDDLANLIPARIAGVLLTIAAARGVGIMWRDASKHASPNAGWPEAALAGALGVRLGGAAFYDGVLHTRPYFGDGEPPQPADVPRALRLYVRACALLWLVLALAWWVSCLH
jgi:adenosylcobinamide-phosphate synthase